MKDLNEFIDEIHDKTDIISVISKYVNLRKQGANFVALCPFHKEKTPSFVVSPTKQIFHCFGCGASGDVIKFLMMIENLDFKNAALQLAKEAGIETPSFKFAPSKDSEKDEITRFNEELCLFFQNNLDNEVLSYLKNRGLKEHTIKAFKIGMSTVYYEEFLKDITEKGFKEDVLLKSGAFRRNEKGKFIPYFRNRLMFPIFDMENKIVGFSGRSMDEETPKYLNTPDTLIFKKGSMLYALNFTKNKIREQKSSIVVEGYFDAIVLFQEGVENVVCSMGTSFTEEQAKLLARFAEKIYFFFDSDLGGRTGAERAIETCGKYDIQPLIVISPLEKDPDEIVLEKGKQGIESLIKNAKDPVIFITEFEATIQGSSPQGKAKIVEKLLSVITKISNKTIIYEYLKKISTTLNIELQFIVDQYNKLASPSKKKKHSPLEIKTNKLKAIEEIITQAVLQKGEISILDKIDFETYFEEPYKGILRRAVDDITQKGSVNIGSWFDVNEDEFRIASELFLRDNTLVSNEAVGRTFKAYESYKMYAEEISRLYEEIKSTKNDDELFNKLLKEYQLAIEKKNSLKINKNEQINNKKAKER
jgi:DNA primase